MAEYLSPGVYVEEFDSGIKAMEGVGTSTAGFVGMAQKGPVSGLPVLITSMADYQRRFGGYLSERVYGGMRFLPYAVEQFFNNGGSSCYVMRVCNTDKENGGADAAKAKIKITSEGTSEEEVQFLSIQAANPGAWGNGLQVKFTMALKGRTEIHSAPSTDSPVCEVKDGLGYQAGDMVCQMYVLKEEEGGEGSADKAKFYYAYGVADKVEGNKITLKKAEDVPEGYEPAFLYLAEWNALVWDDNASEGYENLSFNPDRSTYVPYALKKSQLVAVDERIDEDKLTPETLKAILSGDKDRSFGMTFEGGTDGVIDLSKIDVKLYEGQDGAPDKRTGLTAFKTLSDVSIMAIPGVTDKSVQSALVSHCENMGNRFAILDMPLEYKEVSDLQEFRENVDTSYAAMYHPWLQCYDALAGRNAFLPPSGSMAGVYARVDNARGVHKAPANEVVRNCTGLSVKYNEAEQGKLNPKGINLIRALPGQGIRVWGARTCSSDGNWKYVNVRRLFIFIEESIKANTNWAVFEPNDEMLWSRVEGTIRVFLTTQWRNGALAGATAEEAFFINIGKSTMTEDDILNGRLICVIGVAPVRPAEFVIFRITQKMENAQ